MGDGITHKAPSLRYAVFDPVRKPQRGPIIMISAKMCLCLDTQAPPKSGGAAMTVSDAELLSVGKQGDV